MSGPGFARPDSVRFALPPSRKSLTRAACGWFTGADGSPLVVDDRPALVTSGILCSTRLSTAVPWLAVAGIVAYVLSGDAWAVVRAHGERHRLANAHHD